MQGDPDVDRDREGDVHETAEHRDVSLGLAAEIEGPHRDRPQREEREVERQREHDALVATDVGHHRHQQRDDGERDVGEVRREGHERLGLTPQRLIGAKQGHGELLQALDAPLCPAVLL